MENHVILFMIHISQHVKLSKCFHVKMPPFKIMKSRTNLSQIMFINHNRNWTTERGGCYFRHCSAWRQAFFNSEVFTTRLHLERKKLCYPMSSSRNVSEHRAKHPAGCLCSAPPLSQPVLAQSVADPRADNILCDCNALHWLARLQPSEVIFELIDF